ncbi:hypothetical protein PYDG_00053 [Pseudoalteromonas phage pYD6-A]|uniref:Uncharacterized protein n=1 Tax=Pseudoalteromonas phage pYD6-A TaxID=754052 RepID=M4T3Y3_9CAUD|nr:hypothetical protein PYDG_00053 [Pseudoalteromonas phage pYD6-A]AGH57584.1 hypothetical protein PYDG_00053 [Pseudoalteromonas phage pYD6-A]
MDNNNICLPKIGIHIGMDWATYVVLPSDKAEILTQLLNEGTFIDNDYNGSKLAEISENTIRYRLFSVEEIAEAKMNNLLHP